LLALPDVAGFSGMCAGARSPTGKTSNVSQVQQRRSGSLAPPQPTRSWVAHAAVITSARQQSAAAGNKGAPGSGGRHEGWRETTSAELGIVRKLVFSNATEIEQCIFRNCLAE
jgi:hypothetical protein